jgi:hypothetical protein
MVHARAHRCVEWNIAHLSGIAIHFRSAIQRGTFSPNHDGITNFAFRARRDFDQTGFVRATIDITGAIHRITRASRTVAKCTGRTIFIEHTERRWFTMSHDKGTTLDANTTIRNLAQACAASHAGTALTIERANRILLTGTRCGIAGGVVTRHTIGTLHIRGTIHGRLTISNWNGAHFGRTTFWIGGHAITAHIAIFAITRNVTFHGSPTRRRGRITHHTVATILIRETTTDTRARGHITNLSFIAIDGHGTIHGDTFASNHDSIANFSFGTRRVGNETGFSIVTVHIARTIHGLTGAGGAVAQGPMRTILIPHTHRGWFTKSHGQGPTLDAASAIGRLTQAGTASHAGRTLRIQRARGTLKAHARGSVARSRPLTIRIGFTRLATSLLGNASALMTV